MHNQLIRGLIFIILVFLVTSDLKEIISTLATSSSFGALLPHRSKSPSARSSSQNQHHQQRSRRQVPPGSQPKVQFVESSLYDEDEEGSSPTGPDASLKFKKIPTRNGRDGGGGGGAIKTEDTSSSDFNDIDSLDSVKRLNNRGQSAYAKRKVMKLNAEEKKELLAMKTQLTAVMQEWCLPKLVCELHASVSERGSLTEAEKGLLSLIRETSLGTMGEVVSRYHFAAHMGQLLSGVEGNGCHNFYPNCPLSGNKVLQMMKKVRIR